MGKEFIEQIQWDMMAKVSQMKEDELWRGKVERTFGEREMIWKEMEAEAFLRISKLIEYRSVLVHAKYISLITNAIGRAMIKDMITHIDETLELLETSNDLDEIEYMMHDHKVIDDFIVYVKYGFNIKILRAFIEHFHKDKSIIDTLDYYNDNVYFDDFSRNYAKVNFSEDWNIMRTIYLTMKIESSEFNEFEHEIEEGFIKGSWNYPHELRLFTYNKTDDGYKKTDFHHMNLDIKDKTIDIDYTKTFQYSEHKEAIEYLKEVINKSEV